MKFDLICYGKICVYCKRHYMINHVGTSDDDSVVGTSDDENK